MSCHRQPGVGEEEGCLWGACTPEFSSFVTDVTLGAQSPVPGHILLGCVEG